MLVSEFNLRRHIKTHKAAIERGWSIYLEVLEQFNTIMPVIRRPSVDINFIPIKDTKQSTLWSNEAMYKFFGSCCSSSARLSLLLEDLTDDARCASDGFVIQFDLLYRVPVYVELGV